MNRCSVGWRTRRGFTVPDKILKCFRIPSFAISLVVAFELWNTAIVSFDSGSFYQFLKSELFVCHRKLKYYFSRQICVETKYFSETGGDSAMKMIRNMRRYFFIALNKVISMSCVGSLIFVQFAEQWRVFRGMKLIKKQIIYDASCCRDVSKRAPCAGKQMRTVPDSHREQDMKFSLRSTPLQGRWPLHYRIP